jgi:hypothetical protein
MKTRHKTLEQGIATIDPLADEDLGSLVADSEPEELLTAILSTPTPEVKGRRRGTAPRAGTARWRRPALVAAPAAAAALLALTVGIPGGGGGSETLPALAQVAAAAAAQPAPSAGSPFQYVETREMTLDTSVAGGQAWSVFDSSLDQEWIAKDGSGLVRREIAAPKWASPSDEEAWEAAGRIPFLAHGWAPSSEEHEVPAGHFNESVYAAPDLSKLSTDPAELAAWLENLVTNPAADRGVGNGFPVSVRTMTVVAELLNNPLASPELRAALYEAEGLIPGIRYFGKVTDAIGRHGVAIGAESANSGASTRYLLIFDPESSQVLGTEEILLKPAPAFKGEKTPQLSSAKLFIESRGADRLGG